MFGGMLQAEREAMEELSVLVGVLIGIVVANGLVTEEEFNTLKSTMRAALDQKQAAAREQFFKDHPELKLLDKLMGGS